MARKTRITVTDTLRLEVLKHYNNGLSGPKIQKTMKGVLSLSAIYRIINDAKKAIPTPKLTLSPKKDPGLAYDLLVDLLEYRTHAEYVIQNGKPIRVTEIDYDQGGYVTEYMNEPGVRRIDGKVGGFSIYQEFLRGRYPSLNEATTDKLVLLGSSRRLGCYVHSDGFVKAVLKEMEL